MAKNLREVWVGGRRYYVTAFGNLPSVTTILKETRSQEDVARLEKWRSEEPEADKISNESVQRGRELHEQIEKYLTSGEPGHGRWWTSIWPFLQGVDRSQEMLIEHAVASREGYAGSLDLLATVAGELVLVDWKTAKRRKRREWITDHVLQAAAYAGAVNFERAAQGKPLIGRAAIVIAYEGLLADVFDLNRTELIAAYRTFLGRLDAYQRTHGKAAR